MEFFNTVLSVPGAKFCLLLMVEYNAVLQLVDQNSPPLFHAVLVLLPCRPWLLLLYTLLVNTSQCTDIHVLLSMGEGGVCGETKAYLMASGSEGMTLLRPLTEGGTCSFG